MLEECWLKKTKQMWKFYSFLLSILVSLTSFIIAILFVEKQDVFSMAFTCLFIFFIFAFLFLWSIKCPFCKLKIAKIFVFKRDINKWLLELLLLEKCPSCNQRFK